MVVLPPLSSAPLLPDSTGSASKTKSGSQFGEVLARATPSPGALVAPVRTPLSSAQASDSISRAWTDLFGEEPPPGTVSILTAQWAHETAGGASMYNYNFAGIKGAGPQGFSVAQKTREGSGSDERHIVDRFRAYSSADEGAVDYVKLLSRRFPDAVNAAKQGNAPAFVHALKAHGYFTGDEQAYTRSVVALSGGDPQKTSNVAFDAPELDYIPAAGASASLGAYGGGRGFGFNVVPNAAPFVDSAAMADELSRTALSIAADPDQARRAEAT